MAPVGLVSLSVMGRNVETMMVAEEFVRLKLAELIKDARPLEHVKIAQVVAKFFVGRKIIAESLVLLREFVSKREVLAKAEHVCLIHIL